MRIVASPKVVKPAPKPARKTVGRDRSHGRRRPPAGSLPAPPLPIQPKLEVGAPGDRYEREADRIADEVMRMPDPSPAVGPAPPAVRRMCAECEEEAEGEVRRRAEGAESAGAETAGRIAPEAERAIRSLRSGGRPLPGSERTFFESRLGADLSRVRLHVGPRADAAARSVRARAFTLGDDVVLRQGEYRPGSRASRHLLAHELTHVLQQRGSGGRRAAAVRRQRDNPLEGLKTSEIVGYRAESKIDLALAQSRVLWPYIGGKIERGLKVKGGVDYLEQKKFEEAYIAHARRRHGAVADVKNVGGYFDPGRGRIVMPRLAKLGNLLHEAIHKFADTRFRTAFGNAMDEGVTQYFTDRVLEEYGLSPGTRYREETRGARALVNKVGFETVALGYFLGPPLGVVKALERQPGGFDTNALLSALRKEKVDWPAVIRMIGLRVIEQQQIFRSAGQPRATLAPEPLARSAGRLQRQEEGAAGLTPPLPSPPCRFPILHSFRAVKNGRVEMRLSGRPPRDRCELGLGVPHDQNGINFDARLMVRPDCPGTLELVQLVDTCRQRRIAGEDLRNSTGGSYWLDMRDPLNSQVFEDPGREPYAYGDSPGGPAFGELVRFHDRFKTWLLWRPLGTPELRWPLSMLEWSWWGIARRVGYTGSCADRWDVVGGDAQGGTGRFIYSLPTWTSVMTRDRQPSQRPGRCPRPGSAGETVRRHPITPDAVERVRRVPSFTDCSEDNTLTTHPNRKLESARQLAIDYLQVTIRDLKIPPGPSHRNPAFGPALRRHFRSPTAAQRGEIRAAYERMLPILKDTSNFVCTTVGRCKDEWAAFWSEKVHLCPGFWPFKRKCRAMFLIHEAAHGVGLGLGTPHPPYRGQRVPQDDPSASVPYPYGAGPVPQSEGAAERLKNPDAYAFFAANVWRQTDIGKDVCPLVVEGVLMLPPQTIEVQGTAPGGEAGKE